MTVLVGTMLIFAFAGAEAYAANVIMDEKQHSWKTAIHTS